MGKVRKSLAVILSVVLMISALGQVKPVFADSGVSYADDLFISEYVEGGGYNKAIEIYNGTGKDVDLSGYSYQYLYNGGAEKGKIKLDEGDKKILHHGEVLILANSNAGTDQIIKSKADYLSSYISFNGNDPVILKKGDTIIDYFGITDGSNFAKDSTFVRLPNISKGNPKESNPKDNGEWEVLAKDTLSNLGTHTVSYGSTKVLGVKSNVKNGSEVKKGTNINLTTTTSGAAIKISNYTSDSYGDYVDYVNPIVVNSNMKFKAKAVMTGFSDSDVTEYSYTVFSGQTLTIAKAREITKGDNVSTEGIVTYKDSKYLYFQDETAGLAVKLNGLDTDAKIGDKIKVFGKKSDAYGFDLIEIEDPSYIEIVGSGSATPVDITNTTITKDTGNTYEGRLVKLKNVEISAVNKYGEFDVVSGDASFKIKPQSKEFLEVGTSYESIEGVINLAYGKYALIPRDEKDIVKDSSKVRNIKVSVNSGGIAPGTKVELLTLTEGADIYYTLDGSEPNKASLKYVMPIEIKKNLTLKALAIKSGLTNSDIVTRNYMVQDNVGTLKIFEIQGKSQKSPYLEKAVTDVDGIVTAKLNYKFDSYGSAIKGFYIQDKSGDKDSDTSDGILVLSNNTTVEVGDEVLVTGIVKEFLKKMDFYAYDQNNQLTVTAIEESNVKVKSKGNTLPSPVILGENGRKVPHDKISSDNFSEYDPSKYAIDFYESLEGMRIKIENALVTGPYINRVISVLPDNGKVAKDDGDLNKYGAAVLSEHDHNTEIVILNGAIESIGNLSKIKTGAKLTVDPEGIMDYEWGNYQMYVTNKLEATASTYKDDVNTLDMNNDKVLTIGSYNIYNHGGDDPQSKTDGLAVQIVNQMKNPDILGLVEVQDNDGKKDTSVTDASEVYKSIIAAVKAKGGVDYNYVDIAPVDDAEGGEPGGNIRVGFLYNPSKVTLKEGSKGGSTEAVDVDNNGELTLNPGRIDPTAEAFVGTRKSLVSEFVFRGETVYVIANHLKSKGGDNSPYGNVQQPVLHSEAKRVEQAQIVNNFIDKIKAKNKDAKIVVLGDFNEFQFSNPIKTLMGSGEDKVITDMINQLPLNERFTYSHAGNAQVLDHILVSNNILKNTKVDIINMNSVLSKGVRNSDHDSVVVSIDNIGLSDQITNVRATNTGEVEIGSLTTLSTLTNGAKIYYSVDKDLDLENLSNNILYTGPVKITKDMTIKAIAVKGDKKSLVSTFTYKIKVNEEIISLAKAREKETGTDVIVEVMVTSKPGMVGSKSIYVEDSSAGSFIYTKVLDEKITKGTKLKIHAKTNVYNNIFQLNISNVEILSQGNLIEPKLINVAELNESVEGQFVKLKNVTIKEITTDSYKNSYVKFMLGDKEISSKIDARSGDDFDKISTEFKVGDKFDYIVGYVDGYKNIYKLNMEGLSGFVKKAIEEGSVTISRVKTMDLSFNEKNEFKKGDFINVYVETKNTTKKEVKGTIIVKITKNNKTSRLGFLSNFDALSGKSGIGFDTNNLEKGKYKATVYYWDSLEGMLPLADSNAAEFKIR